MVSRAKGHKVVEHVIPAKVAPYEVVKLHAVAHPAEPATLRHLVPAENLPVLVGGLDPLAGLGVRTH
jgi:glutathione S-transferase